MRSPRNFRIYAAVEAANIVLLPGAAIYFGRPHNAVEVLATGFASASAACFLLVGALYWRALDRRLARADRASLDRILSFADRVEIPFLALTAASTLWLALALWLHGWSSAVVAAGLLTLLAGLEYVNYYHLQLQHFDRWSDFRRLLLGRQLRRSHMSRALAAHRKGRTRTGS